MKNYCRSSAYSNIYVTFSGLILDKHTFLLYYFLYLFILGKDLKQYIPFRYCSLNFPNIKSTNWFYWNLPSILLVVNKMYFCCSSEYTSVNNKNQKCFLFTFCLYMLKYLLSGSNITKCKTGIVNIFFLN